MTDIRMARAFERLRPLAALGVLLLATCKETTITDVPVEVVAIQVNPTSLSLEVGETARIVATPMSESGRQLTARNVSFTSSDASVAEVSQSDGQVTGRSAGNAVVTARSGTASAAVNVTVTARPRIGVSRDTVRFTATVGGANPANQTVTVTNIGGGTLTDLTGGITYATGQPSGWLAGTLGTTAPATMELRVTVGILQAGTYLATVNITSVQADNSPRNVIVILTVSTAPVPPVISNLTGGLETLNAPTCTNGGSLFRFFFDYTDANGNVTQDVAIMTVAFQFVPSASTGSFTTEGTITGNGFSGTGSFGVCYRFAAQTAVATAVNLTDDDGSVSNSLGTTTNRPAGANGDQAVVDGARRLEGSGTHAAHAERIRR